MQVQQPVMAGNKNLEDKHGKGFRKLSVLLAAVYTVIFFPYPYNSVSFWKHLFLFLTTVKVNMVKENLKNGKQPPISDGLQNHKVFD